MYHAGLTCVLTLPAAQTTPATDSNDECEAAHDEDEPHHSHHCEEPNGPVKRLKHGGIGEGNCGRQEEEATGSVEWRQKEEATGSVGWSEDKGRDRMD